MVSLAVFAGLDAQELLEPLPDNHVLKEYVATQQVQHLKRSRSDDTLDLPFVDDFHYRGPYPDQARWMDRTAFVNRNYPIRPPTIGVATMDGLNENGQAYRPGNTTYGPADSLTSNPINLSPYTGTDSIYFSFFYQPQGRGDWPNAKDSLLLEFKADDGRWIRAWGTPGDTFRAFKQVVVPVLHIRYMHNGFQFRFRNYATISGNNDHWHLDYIRLDAGRNPEDTVINDVAITELPVTILSRYSAMPWSHFWMDTAAELAPQHSFDARNNFSVAKNVNYHYEAFHQNTNTPIFTSTLAATNFDALSFDSFSFPKYAFEQYSGDSNTLRTYYKLSTSGDINRGNDSAYVDQPFRNFFAYDDGSAEKAYGLFSSGSKLAYKYETLHPDTLRAIAMHFTHMNKNVSSDFFSIMVWSYIEEDEGAEDSVIYQKNFQQPQYTDTVNGFYWYVLDSAVMVDGIFYIGWMQATADILRIGFDENTDSREQTFHNTDGIWRQSSFKGSLMMRPLVGNELPVGVEEPVQAKAMNIKVYPNPVVHQLYFETEDFLLIENKITIYNLNGRIVYRNFIRGNSVDVSALSRGVYIIRIQSPKNDTLWTTKIVKR